MYSARGIRAKCVLCLKIVYDIKIYAIILSMKTLPISIGAALLAATVLAAAAVDEAQKKGQEAIDAEKKKAADAIDAAADDAKKKLGL